MAEVHVAEVHVDPLPDVPNVQPLAVDPMLAADDGAAFDGLNDPLQANAAVDLEPMEPIPEQNNGAGNERLYANLPYIRRTNDVEAAQPANENRPGEIIKRYFKSMIFLFRNLRIFFAVKQLI